MGNKITKALSSFLAQERKPPTAGERHLLALQGYTLLFEADRIDKWTYWQVVGEIREAGRLSYATVAETVGINEGVVRDRIGFISARRKKRGLR